MKNQILKKLKSKLRWVFFARKYRLESMERLTDKACVKSSVLIGEESTKGHRPTFLGGDDSVDFSLYNGHQISPKVSMIEFENVIAIGRSELVLKNSTAFHPEIIDPATDALMIEIAGSATIDTTSRTIKAVFRKSSLKIDKAISLLSECSPNYAHWVTEVLTRVALLKSTPEFEDAPFLVDTPLHQNLLDSLRVLNVSNRQIIAVRSFQEVQVKKLIHITAPCYAPQETRHYLTTGEVDKPRGEPFKFSAQAITQLRELAIQRVQELGHNDSPAADQCANDKLYGSQTNSQARIYLQRLPRTTWNGRNLVNAAAVEAKLQKLGFSSIEMSSQSFANQIMLLHQAEVVVAPVGAACVNLVFCEPGLSVVLLSPYFKNANFFYWTNLLLAAGHRVYFVLGPQVKTQSDTPYHKNFKVCLKLLDDAVSLALFERNSSVN